MSLRHREGQGWTTKLPTDDARGDLLIRGEFTFPGEDASNPPDEAVALIRAYARSAPLRPVARLRTIRRMIQLLDLDDRLLGEVVDDEVSVLSGRRIAARFRELEVEITDDTPAGLLDEVLDRLRTAGAGAPDPTPKYIRAVGPLATQAPEIEIVSLRSHATVSQVLGRALSMSVVQLLRHDAVVRLDADPEGVHVTRVASRRLRSDLRTFRSKIDHEWAGPLRDELRWLGTVLGEARDADVLLARLAGRSAMIPAAEAPGVAQVIEALEQRRKEAHTSMIGSINGERYVALLDRLVEAAQAPVVLPEADVPVRDIVGDLLEGPWRHLRAAVHRAGKHPNDAELHTVRIRVKRVRYAADAVAPILGKPARRFADAAAGPSDDPGRAQRRRGRRVLVADLGRRATLGGRGVRGRHAGRHRARRRQRGARAVAQGVEASGRRAGGDVTKATAKAKVVRAAGGLVWRMGEGGKEIVVVHRPAYDDWSFPKGKLDDGESELQAALREVEEEISVRGAIGRDLGTISYIDGKGRPKVVRYWEMTVTDGTELHAANEVDDARWVTLADAEGILTYDHDRAMLDRIRVEP